MVFGKKKATPVSKEQPKKSEPKHDLAAKLREQKAQREAEEKAAQQKTADSTADATAAAAAAAAAAVEEPGNKVAVNDTKIDKEWEAKLKEIMKETGQDDSAPRPKGKLVTKPDGSKVYVYDSAYGAAVSADQANKRNIESAKRRDTANKTKAVAAVPLEDQDDMKGFDEFYGWVKNGRIADITDCENVMFGKK